MNKYIAIFLLTASLLQQGVASPYDGDLKKTGTKVHQTYLNDLKNYVNAIQDFKGVVPSKNIEKIRQKFHKVRFAYKNIEHFIDHYDSLKVKYYINGAPLDKAEEHANLPNLIEAQGLQMIDEMLYEDDIDWKALQHQVNLLQKYSKEIESDHQDRKYHARFYFEAARRQIIRIFTLSLTNFDTPGSANGIAESLISLKKLYACFQLHQLAVQQKSKWLYQNMSFLFESSIIYLEECNDFEHFDHLHYYKNHLKPLYRQLLICHQQLNIKTIDELSNLMQSVHYNSTDIFSDGFLNAAFYANTYPRNISKKRVALGRTLFFDPALSANNQGSCASCHHPEKAFTDGLKKSKGIIGNTSINRNSPTIINAVFADRYFWDLEEGALHKQIEKVVVNHKEMGISFPKIVEKLNQSTTYQQHFKNCYPEMGIDKWSITNALINYVISLSSFNSPFDQYIRGETNEIDSQIADGFNLFMGKAGCATCHFPPTFSGLVPPIYYETESEVLGVPSTNDKNNPQLDEDIGRYGNGRRKEHFDNYKHSFKTPGIRNVELTAPYMHNGVYNSLEEVMEFYNNGGGSGLGLDVPHQTLPGDSLHLNEIEQQAIIAFMQSLTDTLNLTAKPVSLPKFDDDNLHNRVIGGTY